MAGRRRSAADLPRAPLELAHPLAIQDGSPPGAELLAGGAGPYAGLLFKLYRALLDWTASPDRRPTCDYSAVRRIEDSLLATLETDPVAPALAVLAGALLRSDEADRPEVAWACLSVSDWAIERGDESTALAFAQLAAWTWPQNARCGWLVGRLLISFARARESEAWFRRAHRVAVWTDDWEGQCRALNSLGLVHSERGRFPVAKRLYRKAIAVAGRRGVREVEGIATHNLFVAYAQTGDNPAGEECAARAFRLYGNTHPRLPELVEDIAHFWNDQGYYARTLPVLQVLASRSTAAPASIRIAAGTARAAGSLGVRHAFMASCQVITRYADEVADQLAARTMYEVGIGAANLGELALAAEIFGRSLRLATTTNVPEIVTKADLALEKLRRNESADPAVERRPGPAIRLPADRLAIELVGSLGQERGAAD